IERYTVCGDAIANGGDRVLELEGCLGITVRLQEPPKLLADVHIADAAGLNLGRPFGPVLDLGADFGRAESHAESFEAVFAVDFTEGFVLCPFRYFAVETG